LWTLFLPSTSFCGYNRTPARYRVYQLLGEAGTYYGVRFGKNVPWVTEFPFEVIRDPQYVGSVLSLFACLSWVPFKYILAWTLGYVFMIHLESKEDPATRAKPISWLQVWQLYHAIRDWMVGRCSLSQFFSFSWITSSLLALYFFRILTIICFFSFWLLSKVLPCFPRGVLSHNFHYILYI